MFTGDRSGQWLWRALHKAGFADNPASLHREDGLRALDCFVSAALRCAPPANKPLHAELAACRKWLLAEYSLLGNLRAVVGLGRVGFEAACDAARASGLADWSTRPHFGHGLCHRWERITIFSSYHPSQQNTFTGRLTEPMLDGVFAAVRREIGRRRRRISAGAVS